MNKLNKWVAIIVLFIMILGFIQLVASGQFDLITAFVIVLMSYVSVQLIRKS